MTGGDADSPVRPGKFLRRSSEAMHSSITICVFRATPGIKRSGKGPGEIGVGLRPKKGRAA